MGKQIIKVAPDRDLYVEWSSVVEAPTAWGTRDWMVEHLRATATGDGWTSPFDQVEQRLRRADKAGTSAFECGCGWDDAGEIYMQQGFLPRRRLGELIAQYEAGTEAVSDLLEPFEDEEQRCAE